MSHILTSVVRAFVRRFLPGIATALEEEGQFDHLNGPGAGSQDPSRYLEVEDNGADTTIIAFAGMAILYAAMPKFEFKKMLQETGGQYNYVFVRDLYRSSYRLAPDGSNDGIAFYERAASEALNQLGAKHNIAIGMSGGGEAAFRISGAAPIHHVVVFNPAFPLERYGSWKHLLHALLNLPILVRDTAAYLEVLFVNLGVRYLNRRNRRLLGSEDPEQPLRDYLRRAAPATLVYSKECRADAWQAATLKSISSVTCLPVASARHNCLAELKKQGKLETFIQDLLQPLSE
jgi:pimeloyl-ACP methyl ester carboxylesterase